MKGTHMDGSIKRQDLYYSFQPPSKTCFVERIAYPSVYPFIEVMARLMRFMVAVFDAEPPGAVQLYTFYRTATSSTVV